MRTLRRYVSRQVFGSTLLVFLALLMLFSFFDFIQELGDVGKGKYRLSLALLKVALSVPGHLYELFPIAALLGTLFAVAQMVAHSEYTVMRVSGVSAQAMVVAILPLGLLFAAMTFLIGEFVAPYSETAAQRLLLRATNTGVVAQEFRSGLWVKDDASFVNVAQVSTDAALTGVRIYEFDDNYRLRSISEARSAEYQGADRWRLRDVSRTRFHPDRTEAGHLDEVQWHSVLNPSILNVLMVVPERMSLFDLYSFIGHLRENQQATARHEIALYSKLVYPLAVIVMMVLALPFAYLRVREGGISGKIFGGIMLGLGFHLVSRLFGHLGLLNAWSPLFSAAFPTTLFFALGALLLWRVERR
ncbi:MAG: LPS export ABC transporter permease LptG [Betaproteobacteria bacterium]|nr:LPS export ABC transporter permease LptG [Betaproteobacteria bacterium]